ncbi:replication protein A 70 kDa DNA-binding subunit C-like protein [Tanacetum coccineum]
MSTESVGTKLDRKAVGMDESSLMKPQEKMSGKSRVTKSESKGMVESSQTKPHLFLDELEVDVTGTIVVMIGRGNMIHCTAKASIAHNFLRLKEGGIYSIKNFVVLPNKDEYRIFKHDKIMLEFDGETTVQKVSVNGLGFLRYPFQLIDFDRIEPANNKYLIDVTGYVTDVGRTNYTKTGSNNLDFYLANQRGQSLRVTLWGGLGDALIERKTKHELKTSKSCVEQKKAGLAIDSSRLKEGTLENLLIWARNCKNDVRLFSPAWTKKGWDYTSCGFEKCRKGVTRQNGYMLEVVVADDTAHTVVVMFNDTTTELLKCLTESLLGAGEDEDDESSLPTAIRNLIGTTHVLEIKSHTYYKYGTFESFTCWKINPSEMVDDGASSSTQPLSADNLIPSMKRLSRHPSVSTPSKPTKERKREAELEDSDGDEVSGPVKDSNKCNADGAFNKKKKNRYIVNDCESKKRLRFHHLTYTNNDREDAQKKVTLQIS